MRHRGITVLLWLHVAALPVVGVLRGETPGHSMFEAAIVAIFGVGACLRRLSITTRSALATLGLVICSAILVHFFDGLIEMHFHFFVMVAVVALYQAWQPYLLAVGFVLLQHSLVGAVAPHQVYSHHSGSAHPWWWALVHGSFILAESITCLMYWRVSEDALDENARRARALRGPTRIWRRPRSSPASAAGNGTSRPAK